MRRLVIACVVLLAGAVAAPTGRAAGWSAVKLPRRSGLNAVSCLSTRWCEAVGGAGGGLEVARWNGRRWSVSRRLPSPEGAGLDGISCRSTTACVAVGELYPRSWMPRNPLIERWDGRRWRIEAAPKPATPQGYRGVNVTLRGVACPGVRLCFAVGRAVPFGAGSAPGGPVIERWDGRHWHLMTPPSQAASPLTSISCASAQACTAVGGFEYVAGRPDAENQRVAYPSAIVRWDGRRWSIGSLTGPEGAEGAGGLGVSCTSASTCLAVGNQESTVTFGGVAYPGSDQAIAATGTDGAFAADALPFPSGVYRGGSGRQPPQTRLYADSCAPGDSAFCAAVGLYIADDGAIGPLVAVWNGSGWSQVALRRGPVMLASVSCPALGWCMAVGGGIAERFG